MPLQPLRSLVKILVVDLFHLERHRIFHQLLLRVLKCILYRHSHCANRLDAEHVFENRRLDLVFPVLLILHVADFRR